MVATDKNTSRKKKKPTKRKDGTYQLKSSLYHIKLPNLNKTNTQRLVQSRGAEAARTNISKKPNV